MRQRRWTYSLLLAAAATLIAVPALGGDGEPNPYAKPDDTWISLSGTIESVERDAFELDYGDGTVTVEMDDGDRDADGYKLARGDKVTVSGMIDDDFFETTKIEAASVYVENLGTYFYASAIDEEDTFITYWTPVDIADGVIQGTVTEVDEEEHEFVLHTGVRALRVDTATMAYDPLDDKGYQRIEVGDRVSITGRIEVGLFEGREFEAESVIKLDS